MLVKHLHFEQNPFPARGIQVISSISCAERSI